MEKLPEMSQQTNLTTKKSDPPSYAGKASIGRNHSDSADKDAVDGEGADGKLAPKPPTEPEMPPPACLSDGSKAQTKRVKIHLNSVAI